MPADTTFKTRSAARRPYVRGACPALVNRGGEVSAEEEKNLGKEGPEDNGGEGQLGREPGYSGPEGVNFFQRRIFVNFCLHRILLSLS